MVASCCLQFFSLLCKNEQGQKWSKANERDIHIWEAWQNNCSTHGSESVWEWVQEEKEWEATPQALHFLLSSRSPVNILPKDLRGCIWLKRKERFPRHGYFVGLKEGKKKKKKKNFLQWRWWGTGTGHLVLWLMSHPWRLSRWGWIMPWATWSSLVSLFIAAELD